MPVSLVFLFFESRKMRGVKRNEMTCTYFVNRGGIKRSAYQDSSRVSAQQISLLVLLPCRTSHFPINLLALSAQAQHSILDMGYKRVRILFLPLHCGLFLGQIPSAQLYDRKPSLFMKKVIQVSDPNIPVCKSFVVRRGIARFKNPAF